MNNFASGLSSAYQTTECWDVNVTLDLFGLISTIFLKIFLENFLGANLKLKLFSFLINRRWVNVTHPKSEYSVRYLSPYSSLPSRTVWQCPGDLLNMTEGIQIETHRYQLLGFLTLLFKAIRFFRCSYCDRHSTSTESISLRLN